MTIRIAALATVAAMLLAAAPQAAQARPAVSLTLAEAGEGPIVQARSALKDFFNSLADDDDEYVHDDHYDWRAYRDSTSRKDRIRDYQRMQIDMQKDYWRAQKDEQKAMIKRQRGW